MRVDTSSLFATGASCRFIAFVDVRAKCRAIATESAGACASFCFGIAGRDLVTVTSGNSSAVGEAVASETGNASALVGTGGGVMIACAVEVASRYEADTIHVHWTCHVFKITK